MQAWEIFLKNQEAELGKETVDKWLRNLTLLRFDACNIYLEARDAFETLWFEEHIRHKAQKELLNNNQKQIKVHLSLADQKPLPSKRVKGKLDKKDKDRAPSHFSLIFNELDHNCTFEHFIATKENLLTYKILREASFPRLKQNTPPSPSNNEIFNPIYIYGNRGSGKTHLLMSIAQAYQAQGLRIIYTRAETFTDHVVCAIREGEMALFREAYRNIDALIVDDVHVFSRKGATQEEFFHTFNTLHLENKQIILAANCTPSELTFIEPRLVSRFEWGIVLNLKTLKKEELEQLLKSRAKVLGLTLTPFITEFLLENFSSNPKSLIKALEAIVLRLHLDQQHTSTQLTLPILQKMLGDLLKQELQSLITPEIVIQIVAEHYGIRIEDILGKSQKRECALPRKLAMYLCRHHLKFPFMKIGDLFGRDHSTVMSSIKQVQELIDKNEPHTSDSLHIIRKKLQF
jgi:chromosomal replication initiator protein